MYKLTKNGVCRVSDNVFIPDESKNKDWREYQAWLKAGNKPQPKFTEEELEIKKQSDIKLKESEIIQVQIQLNIAIEKGFSIVDDYEKQLKQLEKELAKLKK